MKHEKSKKYEMFDIDCKRHDWSYHQIIPGLYETCLIVKNLTFPGGVEVEWKVF